MAGIVHRALFILEMVCAYIKKPRYVGLIRSYAAALATAPEKAMTLPFIVLIISVYRYPAVKTNTPPIRH